MSRPSSGFTRARPTSGFSTSSRTCRRGRNYRGLQIGVRAMKKVPALRIDRFQVKLISPTDPIARAIADFRRMRSSPAPSEIRSSTLGGVYVEHAYVY